LNCLYNLKSTRDSESTVSLAGIIYAVATGSGIYLGGGGGGGGWE
jgi:hypothetical protein